MLARFFESEIGAEFPAGTKLEAFTVLLLGQQLLSTKYA